MTDNNQKLTMRERRLELASLIERNISEDGINPTAIPRVYLIKASQPSPLIHTLHEPAVCLVLQGRKEVTLMDKTFNYGAEQCLTVAIDLPVVAQVVEATPEVPYLCLRLDFEPGQLGEMVLETGIAASNNGHAQPGLTLAPVSAELLDAGVRLVRLLDTPQDIPFLAPLVAREMLYRLLSGDHGGQLRRIALADNRQLSVSKAISWIKENFAEPFRIETVARFASVSPSALHHNFKALTAMSPLQYQKQVRLYEARRLMLSESMDAAAASYTVGYESPSQFSREYRRMFGSPPSRDVVSLRGQLNSNES